MLTAVLAAMVLHPLILDVLKVACHFLVKIQKDTIRDACADVKQELMMALLLSPAAWLPSRVTLALDG